MYLPRRTPGCACERLDVPRRHQEDVEVRALDFSYRLSRGPADSSGGERPLVQRLWRAENAPKVVETQHELKVGRPAAVLPRSAGVAPVLQRDTAPSGDESRRSSDCYSPGKGHAAMLAGRSFPDRAWFREDVRKTAFGSPTPVAPCIPRRGRRLSKASPTARPPGESPGGRAVACNPRRRAASQYQQSGGRGGVTCGHSPPRVPARTRPGSGADPCRRAHRRRPGLVLALAIERARHARA
jgi:hypothetical protein